MKRFSEEEKKRFVKDIATGAFLSVAVFVLQQNRGYGVMRCLSDAFFTAGVLLFGVGIIGVAKKKGSFDVAGYGISHIFGTHFPSFRKDEDIFEYSVRKQAERKNPMPPVLAGAVYLALAAVFTALFYVL